MRKIGTIPLPFRCFLEGRPRLSQTRTMSVRDDGGASATRWVTCLLAMLALANRRSFHSLLPRPLVGLKLHIEVKHTWFQRECLMTSEVKLSRTEGCLQSFCSDLSGSSVAQSTAVIIKDDFPHVCRFLYSHVDAKQNWLRVWSGQMVAYAALTQW